MERNGTRAAGRSSARRIGRRLGVVLVVMMVGLALVAMTPVIATASGTITMTDLGDFDGTNWAHSEAVDINDAGQIAGWSDLSASDPYSNRAFSWTKDGGLTDIGLLAVADGGRSFASAINSAGQIVGYSNTLDSDKVMRTHAFIWSSSTRAIDIGQNLGTWSEALFINDSGEVAGMYRTPDYDTRAFYWTATDGAIDIAANFPDATDINAQGFSGTGQIVGWYYTPEWDQHAFSWTKAGGFVDIGTLNPGGPGSSDAFAVNDQGQVVGDSDTADGERHAFVWTAGSGMKDLGTLGGNYSSPNDINNNGVVVGTSNMEDPAVAHAFIWTSADGMTDIGTLGGTSGTATAVSDSGWVVGWSYTATSSAGHAFAWKSGMGMTDLGTFDATHPSAGSEAVAVNEDGVVVGRANSGEDPPGSGIFPAWHAVMWTISGDMTAPTLVVPSQPVQVEATGPNGATVNFADQLQVSDDVDPSPSVDCSPASGSTFSIGSHEVSCTAKDASGNVSDPQTFSVVVQDTTAPTLDLPGTIYGEATGPGGAVVGYTVTATDLVSGSVQPTCDPAPNSLFPVGERRVQCEAVDGRGNKATGSFWVKLEVPGNVITATDADDDPSVSAGDLTASATGGTGTITVWLYPGAPASSGPLPGGTGIYFDVYVAPGGRLTSVTIKRCGLTSKVSLFRWTGSTWTRVAGQTYDKTTGCVTATLPVSVLSGTIFGIGTGSLYDTLGSIVSDPDLSSAVPEIRKAKARIQNALNADLWQTTGPDAFNALASPKGERVFDRLRQAFEQFAHVREDPTGAVGDAIDQLWQVAYQLASDAVQKASPPVHANELRIAQRELDQALTRWNPDKHQHEHHSDAFEHLKQAWKHAHKAIK